MGVPLLIGALIGVALIALALGRRAQSPPSRALTSSPPEVLQAARSLAIALGQVFDEVEAMLRAGITTRQVEECVAASLERQKLKSSFRGYHGYPSICSASVNDEVVNTIPSERVLVAGDLLKLQIGVRNDNGVAIQGWTYSIGPLGEEKLYHTGREALRRAVATFGPEARVGDLGFAIQSCIEEAGFSVNRQFVGFGMGRAAHEDPAIPGYGTAGRGVRLKPDRVYCIFVIAHAGTHEIRTEDDHWNTRTLDGRSAVLFSQMVLFGENGVEVLTPPRREP